MDNFEAVVNHKICKLLSLSFFNMYKNFKPNRKSNKIRTS